MKYNFDEIVDRHDSSSLKWDDTNPNSISLSVADMDFIVAPEIEKALIEIAKSKNFGYVGVPKEYFLSYKKWFLKYHNLNLSISNMIYATGVVPIISSCVRKFASPGEKVVVLSPCYNIFYNSIINNGCQIVESFLNYQDGKYSINFDDLEEKLADENTNLMIFCNPHNPIGKIWSKEEIKKVGKLALKHNVIVISDEIHCDITKPGSSYIPFLNVDDSFKENTIICLSSSKAFSIPGLHQAIAYVPNKHLYNKLNRQLNTDEVAEPNSFACAASIAAYNKSRDYLDQVNQYIYQNRLFATKLINEIAPKIKVIDADATYLMWLDLSSYTDNADLLANMLKRENNLIVSKGSTYGSNSKAFIRINLATSRQNLEKGLSRFLTPFKLLTFKG